MDDRSSTGKTPNNECDKGIGNKSIILVFIVVDAGLCELFAEFSNFFGGHGHPSLSVFCFYFFVVTLLGGIAIAIYKQWGCLKLIFPVWLLLCLGFGFIIYSISHRLPKNPAELKPIKDVKTLEIDKTGQTLTEPVKAKNPISEPLLRTTPTIELSRVPISITSPAKNQEGKLFERSLENAADRKNYVGRYLMRVEQKPNITAPRLALTVASQNQLDSELTEAMSLMAERSGLFPVRNLFKPEFISDGLLSQALNGDFDTIQKLDLTNWCELLAVCEFSTVTNLRPVFNATSADVRLEIRLFRVENWSLLSSKEFSTQAAAFSPENAVALARRNLTGLLATNSFPYPSIVK